MNTISHFKNILKKLVKALALLLAAYIVLLTFFQLSTMLFMLSIAGREHILEARVPATMIASLTLVIGFLIVINSKEE